MKFSKIKNGLTKKLRYTKTYKIETFYSNLYN